MPVTGRAVASVSRRRPILLSAVLAGLAVFLVIVPGAGSAQAATGDILVSLDGANWSETLPLGLFSGAGTVVPGDSISRTLWIKNATSSPAMLRLSRMQPAGTRSLLTRSILLTAAEPGTAPSPASPAPPDASCALLLPDRVVPAGRSTPIVVTLTVADLHGLQAQGQTATISLIASMSDPGGTAASPCAAGGTIVPVAGSGQSLADTGGSLAFTGGGLPYPAIMIASILTGLGLFVLLAARRRRRAE